MLWLIFCYSIIKKDLKNSIKGIRKHGARWFLFIMIEHETKTKYILSINTCKIFFQPLDVEEPNLTQRIFLTVRFYQSPLRSLMSQNAPPKIILTLLSRYPIARERVTIQSGGRCAVKPRVSPILKVNFAIRWV